MIVRRFLSNSLSLCSHSLGFSFTTKALSLANCSAFRFSESSRPKEETTKLFVPPPREPYNEKDDPEDRNTYVELTRDLYYKMIDEKPKQVIKKKSCYYAIERNGEVYHVFDASRMPYGRMCVRIATLLMGKHKPTTIIKKVGNGDHCIVANALNIKMTGKKKFKKKLTYHTGFVGHLKRIPYRKFMEEKPEHLIHFTVNKMLPKNKLRPQYLEKLQVFRGDIEIPGFPNFVPSNPYTFDPLVHEDPLKSISKENSVVVYESDPGAEDFKEFKDFKRESDPELEKPFEDRPTRMKSSGENKAIAKKYKRYLQILKRYKEYKFKPRKNNDPRNKDFYFITSAKQIKRYHLDDLKDCLVEEAEDDDDDDTMK